MEMRKVLKVIVIRSGILLSLLVVLIMAIKTMVKHGPPDSPPVEKVLIILIGEGVKENDSHIRGIRDGIAYNGLRYSTKELSANEFEDLNNFSPSIIYSLDPCLTDKIVKEKGIDLPQIIMGYSYIDSAKKNYTGIYAGIDWEEIFSTFKKIVPGIKKLGLIYTKDSCNGETQASSLKTWAEKHTEFDLIIKALDTDNSTIEQVIDELSSTVDAIYAVSMDRGIQQHFEIIAKTCIENKLPLIGGGTYGPQKGSVASISHNPYRIGRKCTEIIRALESGKTPLELGIARIEPELYLNLTTAYSIGLIIPSSIRKEAKRVFD